MARCLSPFTKKHENIPFPCGKCYICKRNRVNSWGFRLNKEAERSLSAFFLTLTYETPPMTKNGFMTLKKSDVQKFLKRLRKQLPDNGIKYYAAGEYGSKFKRPHYHLIIFNATPEAIEKTWQKGHVHIDPVNGATINYTLKYISKNGRIPEHKNDDRQKEFSLMSKKLGDNYLTPQMIKWHHNDHENRLYIPLKDGKKIAMPRYFREKIFTREQYLAAVAKMEREQLLYEKNTPKEKLFAELKKEDEYRLRLGAKNKEDRNLNQSF